MNLKVRKPQARRFGRAGESVTRGDRRKRERMFGRPFPPLTAPPKQRREDVLGLTVGASPLGGAPKDHKNRSEILTPVGHPFITHPARRFAPITVRQDWNPVRQELEQVSDSVGIRTRNGTGMLEDLCLNSVSHNPEFSCVDDYFKCVAQKSERKEFSSKARVRVWMASHADHEAYVGAAAAQGYWPWGSQVFDPLKAFLQQLSANG